MYFVGNMPNKTSQLKRHTHECVHDGKKRRLDPPATFLRGDETIKTDKSRISSSIALFLFFLFSSSSIQQITNHLFFSSLTRQSTYYPNHCQQGHNDKQESQTVDTRAGELD